VTNELGAFLRARRAQLSPRDVGLPHAEGGRRVPGLRREEVANLAAISVNYYERLERGRVVASAAVLAALVKALLLSDTQRTHLYALAGRPKPRRRPRQPVRPAMRRMLDQVTAVPALVVGPRLDVLAWNHLAAAVFVDFAQVPAAKRNFVRLLFADTTMRSRHVDWPEAARITVAALRLETADDPDDPDLADLVGELSVRFPDFGVWWAARRAGAALSGTARLRHPLTGDLDLDHDVWQLPDGGRQRLLMLSAGPGSSAYERLQILASWTTAAL
jgi:transcriptional regulator with XRE-family HTH domain